MGFFALSIYKFIKQIDVKSVQCIYLNIRNKHRIAATKKHFSCFTSSRNSSNSKPSFSIKKPLKLSKACLSIHLKSITGMCTVNVALCALCVALHRLSVPVYDHPFTLNEAPRRKRTGYQRG